MKWVIAQGYRQDNPAGDAVTAALPKQAGVKKHLRALPHRDVGDAVAEVQQSQAYVTVCLGVEFVILTAARSGEVRGAVWSEIDLGAAAWTIPPERMKAGREHRVPLSGRAVEVLAEARQGSGGSGWVFPSRSGGELGAWALTKLVSGLGIDGTLHGMRSSFGDWCGETGVAREVAEACLRIGWVPPRSRRMRAVICWNVAARSWKLGHSTWAATGPDRQLPGWLLLLPERGLPSPPGGAVPACFQKLGDVRDPMGTGFLSCDQASKVRSRSRLCGGSCCGGQVVVPVLYVS